MLSVPEQCSRISRTTQVVTVVTFHVHWLPAQVPVRNESPQPSGSVAELVVVAYGQLEPLFLGQVHELLGLVQIEGKWLLDIYVTALLQAKSGDIEVTLRRRRDMDNVRSGLAHKFSQVVKVPFDRESFVELPSHERFPVTDPHDLTIADPHDLRGMSVSDFPASDDSDLKHGLRPARNS